MRDIQSPQFVAATRANLIYQRKDSTNKGHGRKFDRTLLPTPASYYTQEFQKLKIKSEWVKVRCCFHDDSTPSLNINMVDGYFRCFSCGAKGGDVLSFHRLRYGISFIEAVNHFGAWSDE
jgi:hypothetical protein